MSKNQPLLEGSKNGMAISPLLQSFYLRFSSEVVPIKACELLNTVLQDTTATNSSQAYRLIGSYGNSDQVEHQLCVALQEDELEKEQDHLGDSRKEQVLYGMFDGGQFPYDEGYQEVKIGRIFHSSAVLEREKQTDNQSVVCRNRVLNSEYLIREGHYQNFTEPYAKLIESKKSYHPNSKLVFITDGATWMRNWVKEYYPEAIHILDFYHAYEHICNFANQLLRCKSKRENLLHQWKEALKNGQVDKVIEELKSYRNHKCKKICEELEKLLTYLTNNQNRMKYDEYKAKGYLIGSGAIESAVRSVAQQRCKLSGQRWNKGLQPVLNIRCIYRSGKEKRMENIISSRFKKAA